MKARLVLENDEVSLRLCITSCRVLTLSVCRFATTQTTSSLSAKNSTSPSLCVLSISPVPHVSHHRKLQLDYHHNYINPSLLPLSELIPRINKTWAKKGIRVKQHLSEPRPGLWYNDWKVPVKVEDGGVGSQDPVVDGGDVEAQVVVEKNNAEDEAATPVKKVSVMELRAHADRCTSLPEEVVLMGMDGDEGGGDLMIEVSLVPFILAQY